MLNLLTQGLAVQAMQVKANNVTALPTEKTVSFFAAQGKVLVHKPVSLCALRAEREQARMQMCSSPEAA